MKLPISTIAMTLLVGCPGPDANPAVLWLAPDMSETRVKLVDSEPNPY